MAEWACIQWQTPLDSLKEMCEIKKGNAHIFKKKKKRIRINNPEVIFIVQTGAVRFIKSRHVKKNTEEHKVQS